MSRTDRPSLGPSSLLVALLSSGCASPGWGEAPGDIDGSVDELDITCFELEAPEEIDFGAVPSWMETGSVTEVVQVRNTCARPSLFDHDMLDLEYNPNFGVALEGAAPVRVAVDGHAEVTLRVIPRRLGLSTGSFGLRHADRRVDLRVEVLHSELRHRRRVPAVYPIGPRCGVDAHLRVEHTGELPMALERFHVDLVEGVQIRGLPAADQARVLIEPGSDWAMDIDIEVEPVQGSSDREVAFGWTERVDRPEYTVQKPYRWPVQSVQEEPVVELEMGSPTSPVHVVLLGITPAAPPSVLDEYGDPVEHVFDPEERSVTLLEPRTRRTVIRYAPRCRDPG